MSKDLTISVIGAGYVGLTTAAILSNCGYTVYLIELNPERLKTIQKGRSWFFEDGIDPLIKSGIDQKTLIPTATYKGAVDTSRFIFSCVGTPDNPDGSSNLDYVFAAAKEAAAYMKKGSIFIQKSTVPVGTGEYVTAAIAKKQPQFSYVSNPEFLRESTAIIDTLCFDRVVCGSDDQAAAETVIAVYKEIEQHREALLTVAGMVAPTNYTGGIYIPTSRNSAELIKVTANAFLALKISFANSIAKLADETNADIAEVMDAVGADKRIGRAFLNAGRGYGGGCFPKDVSGLISSASEYGVDMQIMTAATELNESMPGYIANKVKERVGTLQGKRVAVLGLAFKAGTSDSRKSPAVALANLLAKNGARVCTYDPVAMEEASPDLRKSITLCQNTEDTIRNADILFIATEWPEFCNLDLTKVKKLMKGTLIGDCMNVLNISKVEAAGLQYVGIGRNGANT